MASSRREFTAGILAAIAHPTWCQDHNVIRTETSLVLVPVTVLDHKGHAVRRLTKDDFILIVDGSAAPITGFDTHDSEQRIFSDELPQKRNTQSTPETRVITNVPAQISGQSTTVILLLDYLNTDLRDRLPIREQALHFFADRLKPGQTFAAYGLSYRLVPLLAPSADPAALIRAAKVALGQISATDPPESGILMTSKEFRHLEGTDERMQFIELQNARQKFVNDQRSRSTRTLAAFRQIARAFAGIPGKKELLWLTGDASPLNPSMLYLILLDRPALDANSGSGADLARTFENLNQANITVFPIDIRGVKNTGLLDASGEVSHEEFNQLARRGSQPGDVNIYSSSSDRREGEAANAILAMESCARETGGEVLRGSNDLNTLLQRARDTWDAYYVLSFVPPIAVAKQGRYVPLKVKVKQKQVRVLHRQGFWLGPQKAHLDPQAAITDAISTSVDSTEIPLRLVAGDTAKAETPFSLFVSLTSDNFDPVQHKVTLVIAIFSTDESGNILWRHGETLEAVVDSRQQQTLIEHGYEYRGVLPCESGTTARIVIFDKVAGRVGSVTLAPLIR